MPSFLKTSVLVFYYITVDFKFQCPIWSAVRLFSLHSSDNGWSPTLVSTLSNLKLNYEIQRKLSKSQLCGLHLPCQVEFPDAFKDQADGTKIQLNEIEKIPGTPYAVRIKAPQGTRLGLLSVDKSVYLLRNENRLTKNRVSEYSVVLDKIQ